FGLPASQFRVSLSRASPFFSHSFTGLLVRPETKGIANCESIFEQNTFLIRTQSQFADNGCSSPRARASPQIPKGVLDCTRSTITPSVQEQCY
ncbi:unnamed protein product, partial [Linum tenue]